MVNDRKSTGRICHSIYRYAKSNNKYIKDYDRSKKSSYMQYLDVM